MVRFSCFIAQMHSQKPKKTVEASAEAMHHALKDPSLIQTPGNSLNPLPSESGEDTQIGDDARHVEQCWKAESMKGELNSGNDIGGHKTTSLRKSQSLGSALYLKGRHSAEDEIIDDETDLELSCADSHGEDRFSVSGGKKDVGENEPSENLKAMDSDSVQISSNIVNNGSIFSIGDPHALEKEGHEDSDTHLSVGATNNHLPQTPPITIKPHSLPDIGSSARPFGDFSPPKYSAFRSRSCEDLLILCTRRQYVPESQIKVRQEGQRNSNIAKIEDDNLENSNGGGYDSISYTGLGKDWIVPVMDEGSKERNNEVDFVHQHHQMPAKDFRIKRIEDWVDSLQHCGPLEENNELSHVDIEVKHDTNAVKDLIAGRADAKVSPGMGAAKRYISSLSATASTAQLTNHGLVVIPFLSCFVSLKVLNLSGNAIVKITAGALPRGLHVLNLSKNNISTIEGLRELTRLRVLDLSYNRIIRIGHGLASCSSLKELNLAGNKISEVEGLHRLLKLTVLDLRFNKISTAKCLGQLAANYSSLQAISLEGNPAQKNVGDEHLKKYLLSLLPHLTYYNRHPIKVGTLKDATDRPVRLGVNAHQFDRGPRFDHKSKRKTSHGLGSHRPASTSTHGLKDHTGVLPPIRSKGKHVTLPPTGSNRQPFEFGSKLLNLKPNLSMPRSRSEGTLRPL